MLSSAIPLLNQRNIRMGAQESYRMKLFFAALSHIPLQVLKPRAKRSPFRSLDL